MAKAGPQWPGRNGRAAMAGPQWPGRNGRAAMAGPQWPGRNGRAAMAGPQWPGRNGRAAIVSLLALTSLAALSAARPAQADLTLTSAGTALGFSLSTFASGFPSQNIPSGNVGPLGIAFPSAGGVLVTDAPGNVRLFPTDMDGQNASSVPVAQNYGSFNAIALVKDGSNIYMTQGSNGDVVQLNPNGTFNQTIVGGITDAEDIVTNPANGHLFVSTNGNGEIFDVDPIAKTKAPFVNAIADGLSLSPDGKTLYGADTQTDHILGFNTTTGVETFDSGFIAGGIDGTASGYGNLAGNIFANNNNGTVVEVNLATDAQTLIASGGSRGDFVTVDPTNGTLLLTQSDSILRLTPGSGGSFNPVPEASSVVSFGLLLTLGLGGFVVSRKRARKA